MNLKHKQRGLSFIGWLVLIAILAFFTVAGLRLTPLYMEYFTVSKVLEAVAAESGISKKSRRVVWSKIDKRLYINGVKAVEPENFSIDIQQGETSYTIEYEVRTGLIGNLDVVAMFKKTVKANPN